MTQALTPDLARDTDTPSPDYDTAGHPAGHDEVAARVRRAKVLLICCVLAESFSPLPLRDLDIRAVQVHHAVDDALRRVPFEYLLGWRGRVAAWSVRWDAARHAASVYFPDAVRADDEIPGLDALDEWHLTAAERTMLTRLCREDTPRESRS
ncbi:hypothetical protein [Amycolatopsis sp. lyj-108]|uniref:hypothetical protein n=1 Tax=Amycolatopsis sp. lyj-108 TaxID=2789286 RepID=UPI003978FB7F